MTNSIVHFEIPANDVLRAKKFYEKIFGWKIEKYQMPGEEYWVVYTTEVDKDKRPAKPGAINGGMYQRSETSAKNTVIVINVANIDSYIKKIKKAGGKVVAEKNKVGDMGFYAQVADTEGNVIGIWEMIKK